MKFEIEKEKIEQILNYLATCPYGQVFELFNILTSLTEINEKKDDIK